MVVELQTNNPTVSEPAEVQEPESGLDTAAEPTVEGTGDTEEQSQVADSKVKIQEKGVNLFESIKKLTPAEQKAFKEWQTDYTNKSQAASEYERRISDYQAYVDSLVKDPEISALLKSRTEKAKTKPDFSKMSDEEIFNYTVDQRVESRLSELEQRIESKYGTWYNQNLAEQGNKLIQNFANEKELEVSEVKQLAKYAVAHRVSLDEAYKVAYFDKIPEQAKQEALEDLSLKKSANLELGSTPNNIAPVMPEHPTVAQALQAAKRELGYK
jgi:hypothetical protein